MATLLFKWLVLSLLPLSLANPASSLHPIYVSVTEINHNAKDKTLEISCKVYAEDLEQTIEKTTGKEVDLEKDKALADQYITSYFTKHLGIRVDGKTATYSYIGSEREKEYLYAYFQVDGIQAPHKFDISNSILQEYSQEQMNIIHVVVNGNRQSTRLNYPDRAASFSF